MEKKEKFFTFGTSKGCFRLLCLFLVLIVLFSLAAQLITTRNHKIEISDIVLDVRGGDLHMELYRPANADSTMAYPCVLLVLLYIKFIWITPSTLIFIIYSCFI